MFNLALPLLILIGYAFSQDTTTAIIPTPIDMTVAPLPQKVETPEAPQDTVSLPTPQSETTVKLTTPASTQTDTARAPQADSLSKDAPQAPPPETSSIATPPAQSADTTLQAKVQIDTAGIGSIVPATDNPQTLALPLSKALEHFLLYNPDVREAIYEWRYRQELSSSNWGEYEPRLVGRINQERAGRNKALFEEVKEEYKLGIEGDLMTGTSYDIGFTQTSYHHSDYNSEIYVGAKAKQSLLKGVWYGAPLLSLRISQAEEKKSLHDLRAKLAEMVEKLCNNYWDYSYRLSLEEFETQSVQVAKTVLEDAMKRVQAGKMSSLDAHKASAELAVRQSRLLDAQSSTRESRSELLLLIADPAWLHREAFYVQPSSGISSLPSLDSLQAQDSIQAKHPEYLSAFYELEKRSLNRDKHKDQRLPSVSLLGSYGVRARGKTEAAAINKFQDPSMREMVASAGIEFEVPLFASHRERHLVKAEEQNIRSGQVRLKLITYKLAEDYLTLKKRLSEIQLQADFEHRYVQYHQDELKSEFQKLSAGKSNLKTVFEVEEKLREAQRKELEVNRIAHVIETRLDRTIGRLLGINGLETYSNGQMHFSEMAKKALLID